IPPVVNNGRPEVNVSLQATLNAKEVEHWLKESPLKQQTGDWVRSWVFGGQYHTDVTLRVPLADIPLQAQVTARAEAASLNIPEAKLELKKVNGTVRYDSIKGLSAVKLRAEHLGQAMQLDIQSPLWQESSESVQVQARGRMALDELYRWQQADPIPGVSGATAYTAQVLVETG